jgi:hypothetical protein
VTAQCPHRPKPAGPARVRGAARAAGNTADHRRDVTAVNNLPRLLACLGASALALAGCGAAPEPPASAAPSTFGMPATVDMGEVPADARAAYLAGLTAIDPGLTGNEDRAIRRAENICADLKAGKDEQTVIGNTVQRLSGGNATINEEQAAQAVELARTHICAT